MEFKHEPIMLSECIENLNINPDGIYVDGTLGGAGHSSKIVERLSDSGVLIGIDRDQDALNASRQRLSNYNNVKYVWGYRIAAAFFIYRCLFCLDVSSQYGRPLQSYPKH